MFYIFFSIAEAASTKDIIVPKTENESISENSDATESKSTNGYENQKTNVRRIVNALSKASATVLKIPSTKQMKSSNNENSFVPDLKPILTDSSQKSHCLSVKPASVLTDPSLTTSQNTESLLLDVPSVGELYLKSPPSASNNRNIKIAPKNNAVKPVSAKNVVQGKQVTSTTSMPKTNVNNKGLASDVQGKPTIFKQSPTEKQVMNKAKGATKMVVKSLPPNVKLSVNGMTGGKQIFPGTTKPVLMKVSHTLKSQTATGLPRSNSNSPVMQSSDGKMLIKAKKIVTSKQGLPVTINGNSIVSKT